jgi:glycosidase
MEHQTKRVVRYDIADYHQINPIFGNMEDFDNSIEQTHKRGLRVMRDIALNHPSSEHLWFENSVAAHKGEANDFKNFYIWDDPIVDKDGNKRAPSNWKSVFEGCMWEWVTRDTQILPARVRQGTAGS